MIVLAGVLAAIGVIALALGLRRLGQAIDARDHLRLGRWPRYSAMDLFRKRTKR